MNEPREPEPLRLYVADARTDALVTAADRERPIRLIATGESA